MRRKVEALSRAQFDLLRTELREVEAEVKANDGPRRERLERRATALRHRLQAAETEVTGDRPARKRKRAIRKKKDVSKRRRTER